MNPMRWPQIVVFVYGLFLVVMGVIGGAGLAGGKPSPISLVGAVFGLAIIYLGSQVAKNPRMAYIGTAVIALLNLIQFVPRYLGPDGKLFPHGLIAGASLITFLALGAAHMMAKSKATPTSEA